MSPKTGGDDVGLGVGLFVGFVGQGSEIGQLGQGGGEGQAGGVLQIVIGQGGGKGHERVGRGGQEIGLGQSGHLMVGG